MHFGYNCKHYLPSYEKCRVLIEERKKRKELLELKWFPLKEALLYSRFLDFDLVDFIEKKKIKIKMSGKGDVSIGITAAWQYDECPLAHGGGQCMYFVKHSGKQITCLSEINDVDDRHPNNFNIPSEKEIENVKKVLFMFIEPNDLKQDKRRLF